MTSLFLLKLHVNAGRASHAMLQTPGLLNRG
jgi:hypothetical protein